MNKSQILSTVDLILQSYPYFKPEDFKLCFTRAKKGEYGTMYDRLDGQVILKWLGEYDNERSGEIEDLWQTANSQIKKREAEPLLTTDEKANSDKPELFKKNIAILLEKTEERKRAKLLEETERRKNYHFDKGPVYEMHQRWIRQFDALVYKQRKRFNDSKLSLVCKYGMVKNPFYKEGKGTPKLSHRKLDISAYLEYKQWQYVTFNMPADQRKEAYLNRYPK